MSAPSLANLRAPERRVIERLAPGDAVVVGSALFGPDHGDVDVAVEAGDDRTMAFLLGVAGGTAIHPVPVPRGTLGRIQDLMSWKNCCAAVTPAGEVRVGRHFVQGTELAFNPASAPVFPDFRTVVMAAKKMERRGFVVPPAEKARAELHLTRNVDSLVKIAREALTDQVVYLLAGRGAVVAGGFFRDEVDGRAPKDIDVFVPAGRGWSELCDELAGVLEEVEFEVPRGKRVNLRKFRARSPVHGHENLVIDVIDYGFVHADEHVVETFDFSVNCLWWSPGDWHVRGSAAHPAEEVVRHIRERRLVVGDNMWYRAGLYRALKRWQRFRGDGYVADEENVRKYQEYLRLFQGRT